ncbi:MAG TPA: hypothetical protein VFZ40_18395 [Pyrinomonadaceae bacterium]
MAGFVIPRPLDAYVFLLAVFLFVLGLAAFGLAMVMNAKVVASWFRALKPVDFLIPAIVAGLLIYLNVRPHTWTVKRFRGDDPIVVVTQLGFPFPLSKQEHVTVFEDVESLRWGSMRMQKEFSRPGFVDKTFAWPTDVLHWFLIVLGALVISSGIRRVFRSPQTRG